MDIEETNKLGWNWDGWEHLTANRFFGGPTHYANLTRGVACAPQNALLCRIQSTQCETGAWEKVLLSVPDDMIARVAMGQFVIVHDRSEKDRETRAMWQGLQLAKIVMELRWFGELRSHYRSERGGESSIQYLKNVASELPSSVSRKFDYFRELAYDRGTTHTTLMSCWTKTGARGGCGFARPRDSRFW